MATAEPKTLEEKLAELNSDQASEALLSATFNDELTTAIDKVVQPVIDKFDKAHPFIALGWELKMDMSSGGFSNFISCYGSMKGHKKRVKAIREYRKVLEDTIAKRRQATAVAK